MIHLNKFHSFLFHQESIPSSTAEKVKEAMLDGVQIALGLPENSLIKPFYSRLQLWYVIIHLLMCMHLNL